MIPILLEDLAAASAVQLPDKTLPCNRSPGNENHIGCVIKVGAIWMDTASYPMIIFSVSVFCQAIVFISMSALADYGSMRKTFLLSFSVVGALATMAYLPLRHDSYIASGLLTIISNVCFGASVVLLNGYLPVLVRNHPDVRKEAIFDNGDLGEDENADEQHGLLATTVNSAKQDMVAARVSTNLSSRGVAIGYLGGVILLLACLIQVFSMKGSTFSLQLSIFEAGIWWLLFTIPTAIMLLSRPGPPLPATTSGRFTWLSYISFSWIKLGETLSEAWHLKDTVWFLIAWSLLADGFTTISSTAILFGKTELGMASSSLALVGLLTVISGVGSAVLLPPLQRRFEITQKTMLLILICMACVIPLYGILGFIPFFQRSGFGGLTSPKEVYVLALWFGLTYGSVQALMRSIYASLIPPGAEVRYFMLYAFSDKGSSFLGPAITALITSATHNIRFAFVFLIFMLALPLPMLRWGVNVERGKKEAQALVRAL